MNVEQISMDPGVARVHYLRFRASVRQHRTKRATELEAQGKEAGKELGRIRQAKTQLEKEDEELKKAYRALSLGQRLINVPNAIGRAGLQIANKLPCLAIAKANWRWCYVHLLEAWEDNERRRSLLFTEAYSIYHLRKGELTKNYVAVGEKDWIDRSFAELIDSTWRQSNGKPSLGPVSHVRATVPPVPPHLRPDSLENYYILWEAVWEAEAPKDPILLSRVNDRMYAVVAQWDLTEIERGVLEGRFG